MYCYIIELLYIRKCTDLQLLDKNIVTDSDVTNFTKQYAIKTFVLQFGAEY